MLYSTEGTIQGHVQTSRHEHCPSFRFCYFNANICGLTTKTDHFSTWLIHLQDKKQVSSFTKISCYWQTGALLEPGSFKAVYSSQLSPKMINWVFLFSALKYESSSTALKLTCHSIPTPYFGEVPKNLQSSPGLMQAFIWKANAHCTPSFKSSFDCPSEGLAECHGLNPNVHVGVPPVSPDRASPWQQLWASSPLLGCKLSVCVGATSCCLIYPSTSPLLPPCSAPSLLRLNMPQWKLQDVCVWKSSHKDII